MAAEFAAKIHPIPATIDVDTAVQDGSPARAVRLLPPFG
jgi:hypothetical protein